MIFALVTVVLLMMHTVLLAVHFGGGYYQPVFVPATMNALGLGIGLAMNGFTRSSFVRLGFAALVVFASMFPVVFALVFSGSPPFDHLFRQGAVQWDGRVLMNSPSLQGSALLTVRYVVWIIAFIYAAMMEMFLLYLLGRWFTDPDNYKVLWAPTTIQQNFWFRGPPVMVVAYLRGFFGFLYFVAIWVEWCLSINEIHSRNALGSGVSYSWVRYDSPHFCQAIGVGFVWFHITPYAGAATGKEPEAWTKRVYNSAAYYWIGLLLLVWGSALSTWFAGGDYAARVLWYTPVYRTQIALNFGIDGVEKINNCFADSTCYGYINPVYDGDAVYTINKTLTSFPGGFTRNTVNNDVINVLIVVFGLLVTLMHGIETVTMRLSHFYVKGIIVGWNTKESRWRTRMENWCSAT